MRGIRRLSVRYSSPPPSPLPPCISRASSGWGRTNIHCPPPYKRRTARKNIAKYEIFPPGRLLIAARWDPWSNGEMLQKKTHILDRNEVWCSYFWCGGEKSQTQALDLISHRQRKSENHSPQHLLILSTGVFVSAMAPAGFNMAIMSRLHRALHARVSSPRSARSLLQQVQSKVGQGAEWQDMQGSPCGTGCWPTKALCGQSGSRCLVIPSGKQGCKRLLGHLATISWQIGSHLKVRYFIFVNIFKGAIKLFRFRFILLQIALNTLRVRRKEVQNHRPSYPEWKIISYCAKNWHSEEKWKSYQNRIQRTGEAQLKWIN